MGGSNLVVEKINDSPGIKFVIGTVDGVEGTFDIVVVRVGEMGYVDICVLQPGK